MKALTFLNKIITSPSRSLNKQAVLKEIFNKPQDNKDVINIYRRDQNNAGDFFCAPHHYFENLKNKILDIYDYKYTNKEITKNWIDEISGNSLIIGGGGLLNRKSFERQMKLFERLNTKGKKTVIWGAGHNSKNTKDFHKSLNYNINSKKFGLVGTRDYTASNNWVPCVSCLHPLFDQVYSEKRDIGIVFHKKTMKNPAVLKKFKEFEHTSNTANLHKLIAFIGSSEKIITDSYHVMYWAILLKKKVVVVPNSSKFFDFKYAPTISTFDKSIVDLKKTVSYSGVLEECREINHSFADKVFNYLNL